MPFQIGNKIRGRADRMYRTLSATVVSTNAWHEIYARIDRASTSDYLSIVGNCSWFTPEWFELDPEFADTNYFDVKPCRWCGKNNHVGIRQCWNCTSTIPHTG